MLPLMLMDHGSFFCADDVEARCPFRHIRVAFALFAHAKPGPRLFGEVSGMSFMVTIYLLNGYLASLKYMKGTKSALGRVLEL
jgi:hypothetical protein